MVFISTLSLYSFVAHIIADINVIGATLKLAPAIIPDIAIIFQVRVPRPICLPSLTEITLSPKSFSGSSISGISISGILISEPSLPSSSISGSIVSEFSLKVAASLLSISSLFILSSTDKSLLSNNDDSYKPSFPSKL